MDQHLSTDFDGAFGALKDQGLSWLPWVGKDYISSKQHRVLIIAESHYLLKDDDETFHLEAKTTMASESFTREIIFECPICRDWPNKTFANLHRALVKTASIDFAPLWKSVAFYNFIQRPMNYRRKERPEWVDFYNSWKVFVEIVRVLKPTLCIFVGVAASNSFNLAMQELRIDHEAVQWHDQIGVAYGRTASVTIDGQNTKIVSIQHTGTQFSWSKWNEFLHRQCHAAMQWLNATVGTSPLKTNGIAQSDDRDLDEPELVDSTQKTADPLVDLPRWLSHKPIIACNYSDITQDPDDDAKYLSVGRAQYDNRNVSVKLFRHSGERWSRQSEEVPIHRVCDMTLILLAAIKRVQDPESMAQSPSILNERVVSEHDLEFLKQEIRTDGARIRKSLKGIKALLEGIDLDEIGN